MTSEERRSLQNGIWLCQSCSRLIDADSLRYPKETLCAWKYMAETASARELEHPPEMNISDSQPHIVESYGDSWFPQSEKHASVTFGYEPIDNFCELTEGSVILIAGHTGIGIDMLVQNVVRHNIKADSRTIYFNLKESCTAIISSILTAESFAKINNSKTLTFTPKEWKRLAAAVNLFERAQLIFEPYTSRATPHKLQSFRLAEVYQHILWITSAVLPAKAH